MVTAPVQKSTLMDAGYALHAATPNISRRRTRAALPVMLLLNDRAAGRAGDDAPGACRRAACHHPRAAARHPAHRATWIWSGISRLAPPRIAVLGTQSARRRSRPPGPRGNRRDRAGDSASCRRRAWTCKDPCRPIPPLRRASSRPPMSSSPCTTIKGLPVIKHVGFGNAVNMTLGLPILRTSVDHGTALQLARTGKADTGSLRAALALAIDLASARIRSCRFVSASASTSCMIPASSAASSTPSHPLPASASSKSVRAAAR